MSTYVSGVPTSVRIVTVVLWISVVISGLGGLVGLLAGRLISGLVLTAFAVALGVLTTRLSEGDRRARDILVGLLIVFLLMTSSSGAT